MACKCTISQRLTGDGCEGCNPAKALEYAKETIEYQQSTVSSLENTIKRNAVEYTRYKTQLSDRIKELEGKLEKAVECLEFYANDDNWIDMVNPDLSITLSPIKETKEITAQNVLKQLKE